MVYGLAVLYTNPKMAGEETNLQGIKAGHFHLRQCRDTDPSVLVIEDTAERELEFYYFLNLETFGSLKKGYCGSKLLVGFLLDWF